eukprot:g58003.t1
MSGSGYGTVQQIFHANNNQPKKEKKKGPQVASIRCKVCNIVTNGPKPYQAHLESKKHLLKLQQKEEGPKPKDPVAVCELCDAKCVSEKIYEQHMNSKRHKAQVLKRDRTAKQAEAQAAAAERFAAAEAAGATAPTESTKSIAHPESRRVPSPRALWQCANSATPKRFAAAEAAGATAPTESTKSIDESAESGGVADQSSGEAAAGAVGAASAEQTEGKAGAAELADSGSSTEHQQQTENAQAKKKNNHKKRKKPEGAPPAQRMQCKLCRVECTGPKPFELHLNSKKHQKNVEKAGGALPEGAIGPIPDLQQSQPPPLEGSHAGENTGAGGDVVAGEDDKIAAIQQPMAESVDVAEEGMGHHGAGGQEGLENVAGEGEQPLQEADSTAVEDQAAPPVKRRKTEGAE